MPFVPLPMLLTLSTSAAPDTVPTVAVAALAALLGLFVGSFLNVVIWRVPRGESVVHPRSHCPSCDRQLTWYENVPVASWVVLRGRCRTCQNPVSVRYPLVELLTAAVFGVLGWRFGASWELPAYLYLGAVGVALGAIDLDTRKLPNSIVLPSYGVAAALLGLASLLGHDGAAAVRAVGAGAALYAFYYVLAWIWPRGMGFGDVKLSGVVGMYLGWLSWGALVVGGFAGFLIGGLTGIVLILAGRAGRKSTIPYGPYMLVGAFVGVLWGTQIADAYARVLGR
ncbi:MAG: prepilin peptidase [Actinomycetes bacterium]